MIMSGIFFNHLIFYFLDYCFQRMAEGIRRFPGARQPASASYHFPHDAGRTGGETQLRQETA